jgi:hypothetical protein
MSGRRRRRPRAFAISFAVTILVLSTLFGVLYLQQFAIPTAPLPKEIPQYVSLWGNYVPFDAVLTSFQNLTMIRTANSSIPRNAKILDIVTPRVQLNNSEVNSFLSVVLSRPNATADIAFVGSKPFAELAGIASQAVPGSVIGNAKLYFVTDILTNKSVASGWMAIIPDDKAIAFSSGQITGKDAISEVLGVRNGSIPSILSRVDIRQMLYIVGGVGGHFSLGIQNFPGVVRSGQMTLISVDSVSPGIAIKYVVGFSDSSAAISQYGAVKSAYLGARTFRVYDSYVLAVDDEPLSALEGAVRLVR